MIADLHLRIEKPDIIAGFIQFLRDKAKSADALYILGDLFETWIGDDDPTLMHREIAAAISTLVSSGVPCYFTHGNRDFLLGMHYAYESGMIFLPEEQVLDLYGKRILIMHGDTLCTNDTNYQLFRKKMQTAWLQKLFLALPLFIRTYIATKIRASSKVSNKKKSLSIMDVNPQTVVQVAEKYNIQWLIHGHTHRPGIYTMTVNGTLVHRIVLGIWNNSRGTMIKITQNGITLIAFPL